MAEQKLAGKAGKFTFNSVVIPFKVVNSKGDRELADSTDSGQYDATSDMVWKSQIPVAEQVEIDIEGLFDLTTTDSAILSQLFTGAAAVPVIINLNATVVYGHGNFDLSGFELTLALTETVHFKATLKSNGIFTHGS